MSYAQGESAFNGGYFDALETRVSATVTCDGLQKIATQAVSSVNNTIVAVTTQLALIQSDYNDLAIRITTLENHIATLAGSQVAFSALAMQSMTVAGVNDLGSALAYLHAQAAVTMNLGMAGTNSFLHEALKLAQELIQVVLAYNRLERQIQSMTALLTDLPARLASLESSILAKASTITDCSISLQVD
jgi:vacuolar-type H+-ATPase subunit D/Vma8